MKSNAIIQPCVEPVFPHEFLNCFAENAFKTLTDYLIAADARQEALDLLDCAQFILKVSIELEGTNSNITPSVNRTLMDCIGDASLAIASLGGVFYAPSGTSTPRADALQGSGKLQDVPRVEKPAKPIPAARRARNKAVPAALEGSR